MSIPINYTDEVLEIPVIYDEYGPIHYSPHILDLASIVGYRTFERDYETPYYITELARI